MSGDKKKGRIAGPEKQSGNHQIGIGQPHYLQPGPRLDVEIDSNDAKLIVEATEAAHAAPQEIATGASIKGETGIFSPVSNTKNEHQAKRASALDICENSIQERDRIKVHDVIQTDEASSRQQAEC